MSGSFFSGPLVSTGPLIGAVSGSTPQEYSDEFGPSIHYKGCTIPDVRFQINKDNPTPGSINTILDAPTFVLTDATPVASNTALTGGGNATSGTALVNIASSAAGANINIPFYQFNTNTLVSNGIALDFGFGTLSCASGSATATPSGTTIQFYYLGQWLCIADVGNAGGTIPLFAQVVAIGASTITLSTPALATNSAAAVGQGNIFNTTGYGSPVATAHVPRSLAGFNAVLDPKQTCSRAVGITCVSGGAGGAFTVRTATWDGQLQSETITVGAGVNTVWGKKTAKWFISATPAFSDAHGYTVVTSDTFGFALRSDVYEYVNVAYNGVFSSAAVSTSNAWTAADITNPATLTTGDVRGTFQVSARGANGTVTSTTYPDGTKRLFIQATLPLFNLIRATQNNPVPTYGVTPFSN